MADPIKEPAHYTGGAIEPKDFIIAGCFPHYVASAIEYLWRHKRKNGAEDLRKAAQCLRIHAEAMRENREYYVAAYVLYKISEFEIDHCAEFYRCAGAYYPVVDFLLESAIETMIAQIEAAADAYEQKETSHD